MRWFVEVTRVGKGEVLDEFCLDASHWQSALKKARELRGDGSSLEGLSVEISDDGCRALDGATAVRFVVIKAPNDAPLAEKTSGLPSAAPSRSSSGPAAPLSRPLASSSRRSIGDRASQVPDGSSRQSSSEPVVERRASVVSKPMARQIRAPESAQDASAASANRSAARAAPRVLDYDDAPGTPPAGTPMNQPRPSLTGRAPDGPSAASPKAPSRAFELLSSRTSPAAARMPLAHHERSYGMRVDLSAEDLEAFAFERLEDVRSELLGTRSGNVVDIAVFSQPFEGRPTEPPLATLRWCDWLEEPEYLVDPFPAEYERGSDSSDDPRADDPRADDPRADEPIEEAPVRAAAQALKRPTAARPVTARLGVVAQPVSAPPAVADVARPRVLPKAMPLKTATLSVALSPAELPALAADLPPAAKSSSSAAAEAANLIDDPQSEDGFLTSKRPLGSKRAALGARVPVVGVTGVAIPRGAQNVAEEKTPAATSPRLAVRGATPGPLAGSKPVGATRLGGGAELKPTALGRTPAPASSSSGAPPDVAVPSAAGSRRTVVTAEPPKESTGGQKVVAASAGAFESSASRPRLSRSGAAPTGRPLSREEKDAKFEAARAKASTFAPPAVREGKRVAGDELLTDLFESLSDLHFQSDVLEAVGFVLALALEKLPSEVGMVSIFDLDRREYVVVRQEGGKRSSLLLRGPDSSPFVEAAVKAKHAVVENDAGKLDAKLDIRWKDVGVSPRSFLCAPVLMGGRTLGLIELANPAEGGLYEATDGNALTYIAKQFAEFLDTHGVLIDPDAVLAAADGNA